MTIHQPSTQVYNRMDKVMFLNKGLIRYIGSPHGIVEYTEKEIGKPVPPFANLAELLLEYFAHHDEDRDHGTNLTCDCSEKAALYPYERKGSRAGNRMDAKYANTLVNYYSILHR